MQQPNFNNERVKPGTAVAAVFYVETQPYYAYCRVLSTHPFKIECVGEQAPMLSVGSRIMLVFESGKGISRAVSSVVDIKKTDAGIVIDAEAPTWESMDKRCYPRYEMRVPASVRTAIEVNGQTEFVVLDGYTENIGLGGAWVNVGHEMASGSLVEVRLHLLGDHEAKILGVVVRTDLEQGFAVQFLDFVGSARYHLHNQLSQAA